jgi:hypothetical protein
MRKLIRFLRVSDSKVRSPSLKSVIFLQDNLKVLFKTTYSHGEICDLRTPIACAHRFTLRINFTIPFLGNVIEISWKASFNVEQGKKTVLLKAIFEMEHGKVSKQAIA